MTVMASKRFYVGNLFPDVQESDLEKLFKTFGPVNNVEIKKKSDIDGKLLTTFAFVQVQIADESDVSKCIQKFNNLKWKKHLIKVQWTALQEILFLAASRTLIRKIWEILW